MPWRSLNILLGWTETGMLLVGMRYDTVSILKVEQSLQSHLLNCLPSSL